MGEAFLFRSSRAQAAPCTFSQAVLQGLAPDGGLYVPVEYPRLALIRSPLSCRRSPARRSTFRRRSWRSMRAAG
jgi:threonine synthase